MPCKMSLVRRLPFFGYFNRDNQVQKFDPARSDAFSARANTMGVTIADSSAVGYYFSPQVSSANREGVGKACEVFTPDRRRRRFTFDYDPRGNGGGRPGGAAPRRRLVPAARRPPPRRGGGGLVRFGLR